MSVMILFAGIVLVVFIIAFISSRRFGPLALALAAGSMLAEFWAHSVAVIIGGFGITIPGLPHEIVATLLLLLLPLFILLLGGPKYYGKHERIISALLISFLVAALLVRPLGRYLTLSGDALEVYKWLSGIWQYIVTVLLILGLADMFLLHSAHSSSKKH